MTRILLVETAFPKRVRKKAEDILAGGTYPAPEITILCRQDTRTIRYLGEIQGAQVVPLREKNRRKILKDLSQRNFDILHVFWTGEHKYRRMKLAALHVKAKATDVDIGDGSVFRLTWKAYVRHWQFRRAHPLPTDHWDFVSSPEAPAEVGYCEGEKILLIQSAEPPYVLRALESLRAKPLFRNPRYVLFCRNRPEDLKHFRGHPMIHEIRMHSEMDGSLRHLKELRRERFDAVVIFFTGDRGYWKMKYLPFLLGARHKVVFNEHNDCFYFTLGEWLALLSHRLGVRPRPGIRLSWTYQARILLFLMAKVLLFPFRFVWLLLIWLRLRGAAWLASS